MKFAINFDLPIYSDKDSFFLNFPSWTPWNVDLYCNSISDFWLGIWALQQTLTCYLFTLTRQLFHNFLHSVLREYYIWNKIIIQTFKIQFFAFENQFCWWIKILCAWLCCEILPILKLLGWFIYFSQKFSVLWGTEISVKSRWINLFSY